MRTKITYLIVSTEDDVRLVKGGIGTYLGLLVQAFSKYRPDINLIWLTESPNNSFFVERRSGCRVFYMPKSNLKRKICRACERICKIFADCKENKVFIEAPDWEGLLSDLYSKISYKNVIKITRLHSVLELTKQESVSFSKKEKQQIRREHEQLLHTDIISAPTQYVYDFTCHLFKEALKDIPHFIIPNFINGSFENKGVKSREEVCCLFNREVGKNVVDPLNKNVFCVGSTEYRKGTDLAIKIAQKIIDKYNNIHFYFLGHYEVNGNSLTLNNKYSLKSLNGMISPNYLSHIHICGYFSHDKLKEVYPICDTFLFTYRHDNFPGALIEACLTGKNIVYMPRGGSAEIMRTEKKLLGLPFDGKDDEEIVKEGCLAVEKSIKHPQNFLAEILKDKYIEKDIFQQMSKCYGFE